MREVGGNGLRPPLPGGKGGAGQCGLDIAPAGVCDPNSTRGPRNFGWRCQTQTSSIAATRAGCSCRRVRRLSRPATSAALKPTKLMPFALSRIFTRFEFWLG